MAGRKDCSNKHCNEETYASMSFLAYFLVALIVLSVFTVVLLAFG